MSKYAPHRLSTNQPRATSTTICQKCLGTGHYIFECKSTRPYVSRPSRTQLLENPKLLAKIQTPVEAVQEEFKNKSGTANMILEAKEKAREGKGKQKHEKERFKKKAKRSPSLSDSDTSSSSSSNSDSESESDTSSSSSSSDSSRSRK